MTAIKQGGLPVTSIDLCLIALWRLCGKSCEEVWRSLPVDVLRSVLDDVSFLAPDSSSAMAPSVVALLKTRIIDALFRKAMDEEVSCVLPVVHDLVPADIALRATTEEDSGPEKPFKHYIYRTQWSEAKLEVLVEFLESAQNSSPSIAIETITEINCVPTGQSILPARQIRCARGIAALMERSSETLKHSIIFLPTFVAYRIDPRRDGIGPSRWLTDPMARSIMADAFSRHPDPSAAGIVNSYERELIERMAKEISGGDPPFP
jgi:hypothetical protein